MPAEKLTLLHDAVMRACDAKDGVKDGLIEDPTRCKFDPQELECKGTEGSACLSSGQVQAARKMYSGAIEGRPESAYNASNSALRDCNTVSVSLRTSRKG